ncbi:MAG: hypothetical protein IT356_10830 [Gemmatimonadaceae bacterium]|nr:hypothetical protein [Gemmatimonadaceae bacterium]
MTLLRLDDARMRASAVPSGVTPGEWNDLTIGFGAVHAAVVNDRAAGRLGFLDLEAQAAETDRAIAYARTLRGRFTDVAVLGIGGSALGAVALRSALDAPPGAPRLHVMDNSDPHSLAGLLATAPLATTYWIVVSKSGTTVETLAQYAIVRHRLVTAGIEPVRHMAFVTDPVEGPLRAIAVGDGITAFEVPASVGGRFSALTPVVTLPAALAGYDVGALLAGARAMRDECMVPALADNPAGIFASLLWRAHRRTEQGTHVMMPYSDQLRDIGPWFVQLWAESLGKLDSSGLPSGPTPLAARGAADQHSLLQLLMQGPADKVVVFVRVGSRTVDLPIPPGGDLPEAAAFLRGRTLGELIDAEADATARALVSAGRPSLTVTLDAVSPQAVGALMMMLMLATVYAGALYRVDPLGQPGVELGKRLVREAMGRRA